MNLKTLIAAPLVLSLAATAMAQKISDDVIKIGVLTDLSGAFSDVAGQGSVIAARMAVQDFANDGKLLGKRIEVVSADHQNNADVASNKAREWYDRDQVDVIVDLVNSTAALAVMDVAERKQRLTLVSGAAGLAITNERCNAFNVHWAYDLYPMVTSLPEAVVKAGKRKWYFITVDYGAGHYTETQASQAVRRSGGEVLGAVRHPFGSTADFASLLLKAQSSGADVIALANSGQDAINTIKQASEFGIVGGQQTIVPMLLFINDVHTLGLKRTQGMNLVEGFYWDRDDRTRSWSRRFLSQHKRMPNVVQAGVYSSVLNYLKAVRAAGTDEASAVMAQLRSMEIDDGLFKGKIRADGRLMHDMLMVEVKKPSESVSPWDYYRVRTVIPAEGAALPLSQSKCKLIKN